MPKLIGGHEEVGVFLLARYPCMPLRTQSMPPSRTVFVKCSAELQELSIDPLRWNQKQTMVVCKVVKEREKQRYGPAG